MKIKHILKGNINVIFGINSELSDYRIENACKKCKVSHNEEGHFTNSCLKRNGGCGCPLRALTSQTSEEKCAKGIWYDNVIDEDKLNENKMLK